jgi:phospholipid/cholesterol/gamma-HCH transport system substrate-binding protein
MKVKFHKIERIAGLFIVVAIIGAASFTVLAAIKKGWFQTKVEFRTKVLSAEGLRPGSQVTISGIRAGEITDVELLSADNIIVHFNISEKFHKQIRKDSKVYIVRPFVIGDKAIELTVGSNRAEIVKNGAMLESEMSFDMLELISGKKLGPFLGTVDG